MHELSTKATSIFCQAKAQVAIVGVKQNWIVEAFVAENATHGLPA